MNDTDIAWCAGFFDGEGHVSYQRSYPNEKTGRVTGLIMCSVPQNSDNIEVLEFFQATIGFGKIKGPYKTASGNIQHRVIFGIKEVEKLLIILKPYLKSKKTMDFQRAILLYYAHSSKPTADDYKRLIKRDLKKAAYM